MPSSAIRSPLHIAGGLSPVFEVAHQYQVQSNAAPKTGSRFMPKKALHNLDQKFNATIKSTIMSDNIQLLAGATIRSGELK